MSHSAP